MVDDEYSKGASNGRNGFNKVRRASSDSSYSINSGAKRVNGGNINGDYSPRVSKRNFISRMSPRSGGGAKRYKDEPLLKAYESSSSSEEETGAQKRRRMRRSRDLEVCDGICCWMLSLGFSMAYRTTRSVCYVILDRGGMLRVCDSIAAAS